MNTVIGLFGSLWNALGCVSELLGYLLRLVSVFFRTRASLAARLLWGGANPCIPLAVVQNVGPLQMQDLRSVRRRPDGCCRSG